ncbi:sodium:solute symporter family protein [Catalinimonas niigatensis]|uniref:sodium:solute symporter family protein n=1 Tax=Catalinimonas niigatensis TaxID=1397264 RepID=UPI002666D7D8|nr:sodium:solute symporter family protein [Catalinimonas niigatensis]WPP51295.1 sodium:solute symporter family protein [Catalinimonas niigatensis]
MLLTSIIIYIAVTLLVGIFTSRFIQSSKDFVLAGRKLPLVLASSALFATWFGSETVLGASSEFVEHGLLGVIEDPFGAALCLLLVGLLIARPLYKLNILTFCDFYRDRYGKRTEILSSLCMVPSYFGWIAAQLVALGIIFHSVAGISIAAGIIIGAIVVVIYTYVGGMWAISITDFIQSIIIIAGLVFLALDLFDEAGGLTEVIARTPEGFFQFFPEPDFDSSIEYFAAWITIGLGSIAQQDIFQRVMASKSANVAVKASYLAAFLYLSIGFIPLFIGLAAMQVYPEVIGEIGDTQLVIPTVVLQHAGIGIQVLFFGALISAIMSTTSGAILAPATILAENLIRPYIKDQSDHNLLRLLRISVVLVAIAATIMANIQTNIYDLVAQSSALSLVSLFVPLMAGLYWKRSTELGALLSIVGGMSVWIYFEIAGSEVPTLLSGLLASIVGMILGNVIMQKKKKRNLQNIYIDE